MPVPLADAPIRRRDSWPYCGRLLVMPTGHTVGSQILLDTTALSIDFPAMPDSIDLNRTAVYEVTPNIALPEGLHFYKGTTPLEIPVSFRLHAFDQAYCPNGAYTLLQVAARLHAFILPIDTQQHIATGAKNEEAADEATLQGKAKEAAIEKKTAREVAEAANTIAAPVTLQLQLIHTDVQGPGIMCIGYLKEVAVKLNGPWLRGPNESYNLPSSGDFSFTFVHHPGHGNAILSGHNSDAHAYAHWVQNKFYNTRDAVNNSDDVSYQGLKLENNTAPRPVSSTRPRNASLDFVNRDFLSRPLTPGGLPGLPPPPNTPGGVPQGVPINPLLQ